MYVYTFHLEYCVSVCVCLCMCVRVYLSIHPSIHLHTHTHTDGQARWRREGRGGTSARRQWRCIVCPQRSTRHSEVEVKRFSWHTGQFWCMLPWMQR